jgi:hypothetical protein
MLLMFLFLLTQSKEEKIWLTEEFCLEIVKNPRVENFYKIYEFLQV